MLEGRMESTPTAPNRVLRALTQFHTLEWPRLILFNANKREPAYCVLLVSAALFFSPFLLFGHVVAANTDMLHASYPSLLLAKHDFLHGSLGLWNPYVYSGLARAAEATPTMFYPEHWILFLVPSRYLFATIAFLAFAKVWLVGVAAYYFYCAELLNCRWALFAAIAFQLSGMTIWLFSVYVSALSLMLFYVVLLALIWTSARRSNLANYLLWSSTTILMLMAGDIALSSYALLGVGILFLYRTLSRRDVEPMLGRLALFTVSSLTALAVFSIRLFPTLAVMHTSSSVGCCLPEFANTSFLIARYFDTEILGVHFDASREFFRAISPLFETYQLHWAAPQFFGVAVALLALWMLASEKTAKAAFWSIYVIVGLALLTRVQPLNLFAQYLLYPVGAAVGMQLLFMVGLPVLAALGGMSLERSVGRVSFPRTSLTFQLLGFALVVIALFLLMILMRNITEFPTYPYTAINQDWRPRALVIALLLSGGLILWTNRAYPALVRAAASAVLACILAAALFVLLFWSDNNPTFLSHLKNIAVQLVLFTTVAFVLTLISHGRSNEARRFGRWGGVILVPLCLFVTLYPWTEILRASVPHEKGVILAALGGLRFALGVAILFLVIGLAKTRRLPARSIYIVFMILLAAEQVPAGKIDSHMGDNPFYGSTLYPPLRYLIDTNDKTVDLANYRVNYPNALLRLQFNDEMFGPNSEPCGDSNVAYGIRSYGGYIDVMPDRFAWFFKNWATLQNSLSICANQTNDRLLDLFAVGYQYDTKSATIVRRASALSQFMLFTEFAITSDDDEELQILKDAGFDPREKIVLEAAPDFQSASSSINGQRLTYTDIDSDHAELRVQSDRPSILLFNDSFDAGWKAKVNDRPQEVKVANYIFMAIPIPAGESHVVLEYRPRAFQIGAICAVASLMVLGLAFAIYLVRHHTNRPRPTIAKVEATASSVFRRYRVLSYVALSLSTISVIQIISGGFGPLYTATTAEPLYSYRNFNIVRVGESYLGVAQELGPIDLVAVMAHKAPRPPVTKFVVTSDLSSLQATLEVLAAPTAELLYSYKNFNIVRFGESYLGVAQELGQIDLAAIMANRTPRPPATKFVVASDVSSLQTTLEALAAVPPEALAAATPQPLYSYKNYNIVRFGELYFGFAQELGQIDLAAIMANKAPRPPATKFVVASDVSSLQAALEVLAHADDTPELLYAYQGYNLLRVEHFYIAIAKALGPVDVRRDLANVLANVVGPSPREQFVVAHDIWSLKAWVIYMNVKSRLQAAMNADVPPKATVENDLAAIDDFPKSEKDAASSATPLLV